MSEKDSRAASTSVDPIERAHLADPADTTYSIRRRAPADDVAGLIRRFWLPVWSVPPGAESRQRVLQYPVCLLVVTADYARFYGVVTGLSETVLTGDGWAVGVMFTPAAGALLTGDSVESWTDRHAELDEVFGERGTRLAREIREAMAADPQSTDAGDAAMRLVEEWVRPYLPVDDDGRLIDAIVEYVETDSDVTAVSEICGRFSIGERSLQRLTRRRLGLTPKWLIQRRRLQEAAERLRDTTGTTGARIAAELGYADESHFVHDFARVTGMTPGAYAATFT